MTDSPSRAGDTAVVQPAWHRRQWLTLMAWVEDHPRTALTGAGLAVGSVLFYAFALNGFVHLSDSVDRWRVENFGGVIRRERSIQLADVVIAFRPRSFDRLDSIALGGNYLGINAFDSELAGVLAEPTAQVRVIGLDPRLALATHPRHAEFVELAKAFGAEPWEYGARCWHAAAVLLRRQQQQERQRPEGAARLQIRLVTAPLPSARAPYFSLGRSAHFQDSRKAGHRLDVLVPRPQPPRGTDSLTHPGLLAMNRPQLPEVQEFTAAFEEAWAAAIPLDAALRAELLTSLDGQATPGN